MEILGLYPTWSEPFVGNGWVVGIIATIHVLMSHTAVGAALFFTYLATIAYRDDRPELLDYIKSYGLFLLIFSYVLGSITGPGIWYSTTVASPRGISALIHSFVWKWATEWVFFVIEVVGVYLIIYLIGKVDKRTHLKIAWIFGLASLTTMLIIVGILSFMMWPGKAAWFAEGGYLNGFYGSNTFAHLAMRVAFMFTMTAVVGGIVVAGLKDKALKRDIARRLGIMGLISGVIGFGLLKWYMTTLPPETEVVVANRLPAYFDDSMLITLAIIGTYFIVTMIQPRLLIRSVAATMTVVILVFGLWPEETARESIRKPFVAGQYLYSNQIVARDVPGMNIESELPTLAAHGVLATHPFLPDGLRTVTPENAVAAGEAIALTMCSNCHNLSETGIRPIRNYFGDETDVAAIRDYLKAALSTGATMYMPAMPLTHDEFEALAVYIAWLEDPAAADAYAAAARRLALDTEN
ncbi:c-type cytochrome [Roseospira navarrensis]|uniref:c-type cytochrome n=1 Tax=Roseospira navarrensis TaxID=140058 RepID=UPI001B88691F|nr:cytochrome c [Roseospira navarrensis]